MNEEFIILNMNHKKRMSALLQSNVLISKMVLNYQFGNSPIIEAIDSLNLNLGDEFRTSNKNDNNYLDYVRSLHFLQLISETENYFFHTLRLIIKKYPYKISDINISLSEILSYSAVDEIVDRAIYKYLNNIFYKRPNEYKSELIKIFSCEINYLDKYWTNFVEMKARRDLGIHNNWRVNETYLRKIQEVGLTVNVKTDDIMSPPFEYFIDAVKCIIEFIDHINIHLQDKFK